MVGNQPFSLGFWNPVNFGFDAGWGNLILFGFIWITILIVNMCSLLNSSKNKIMLMFATKIPTYELRKKSDSLNKEQNKLNKKS